MSSLALAWRNLLHQRLRTLISLTGVSFAVLLIFMQLGFYGSVARTATQLFDALDFDLALLSREYIEINRPASFPRGRLAQAQAGIEVSAVRPLLLGMNLWKNPNLNREPHRWNIMVVGVRPADLDCVFRDPDSQIFPSADELRQRRADLTTADTVVIDRQSWPEYGDHRPGSTAELADQRVTVVGECSIGTGFGYNGLILASERTFQRVNSQPDERVNLGLIQLRAGADPRQARQQLQALLPDDVIVLTRDELNQRETEYWLTATSVGQFFSLGVIVAVVVGTIFVYQMITGDIRKHQGEYATLKAMGYPRRYLACVVICQALLLSIIGYLPGLAGSIGCYALTRELARIPIVMTVGIAVGVLLLTVSMCTISGLLAVRRVHTADPADLF